MHIKSRQGFGVLELLVFAAIFSVIAISFLSILVVVTRIQVRQTSASQVNKESVFLLQIIQRYVETSSLVDMSTGTPTSTLTLRLSSSTVDPTKIFLSTSTIYIQEGTNAPQPLTSPKVTIPSLQFTKYSNPPGHDSVKVFFTVAFNTQNITQKFDRTYVTAIARVSAATFDAGIYPVTGATDFRIGDASRLWQSINDKIYFFGSGLGIGVSNPAPCTNNNCTMFEINGGLRLNTSIGRPNCGSGNPENRGVFWITLAGANATDTVEVCVKKADGSLIWAKLY